MAVALSAAVLTGPSLRTTPPQVAATPEGRPAALLRGHWNVGERPDADHTLPARLTLAGDDVIAIGGFADTRVASSVHRWSTRTREWSATAVAPASIGVGDGAVVWTGKKLLVMPGSRGEGVPSASRALLYDPGTDRWSGTSEVPAQLSPDDSQAVWTGSQVVVAGAAEKRLHLLSYAPDDDTWREVTPDLPADHDVLWAKAVGTPRGVIVWSFWERRTPTSDGVSITGGVDVFLQSDDGWKDITPSWSQELAPVQAFMAGDQLEVIPGGRFTGVHPGPRRTGLPGVLVDLGTFVGTTAPAGPLDDARAEYTWTGSTVVAASGNGEAVVLGESGSWEQLPTTPRLQPTALLWTGREIVTMTDDGRITTFGSEEPAALPGCPTTWPELPAVYDQRARLDIGELASAEVCVYRRVSETPLVYRDAERSQVADAELGALQEVLLRAEYDGRVYQCKASLTTAVLINLIGDGQLITLTAAGSACGLLNGQGHRYPWPDGFGTFLVGHGFPTR